MTSTYSSAAGIAYSIGDPGTPFGWGCPSQPSDRPDIAIEAADLESLSVRGASARGRMHRYVGTPRQDGFSVAFDPPTQHLVVTVCDGVGSLARSHDAADLVARLAPDLVRTRSDDWSSVFEVLSEELVAAVTEGAAGASLDPAQQARLARRTWATTACIAEISPADGGHVVRVAAVGDSPAWLLRDGRWTHLCGQLKTGDGDEPASTRTAALPASSISWSSVSVPLTAGDAVFLMSDGVADPLGGGGGEVGAALGEWWAAPPDPHVFAAQIQFGRRGFQDDRTAVGVWVVPDPPGEAG